MTAPFKEKPVPVKPAQEGSGPRPRPIEPESLELPTEEAYRKLLSDRIASTANALRLREDNIALAQAERASLVARLEELEREEKVLAREIAHGRRATTQQAALQVDLTASTMDIDWYEEERTKQNLRELIELVLRENTIPPALKQKYGGRLVALVLAARVNEDLLLEYLSEQRQCYTAYVDRAVTKITGNRDEKIEECLRWALQQHYLKLPPRTSKRAPALGAVPAATGATPPVVAIWNKIVKAEQEQQPDPVRVPATPIRRRTAVVPVADKRSTPERQNYDSLKELLHELRTGNQLEIIGTNAGKTMSCHFTVDTIQESPKGSTLLVRNLTVDGKPYLGTFTAHLPRPGTSHHCVITKTSDKGTNISFVLQSTRFVLER